MLYVLVHAPGAYPKYLPCAPHPELPFLNHFIFLMDYTLNTNRVVLQPSGIGADFPTTSTLQSLFEDTNVSSIAFQSVLVAAIQIAERVREEEVAVSKAAISLAHRQQLSHLLASVA